MRLTVQREDSKKRIRMACTWSMFWMCLILLSMWSASYSLAQSEKPAVPSLEQNMEEKWQVLIDDYSAGTCLQGAGGYLAATMGIDSALFVLGSDPTTYPRPYQSVNRLLSIRGIVYAAGSFMPGQTSSLSSFDNVTDTWSLVVDEHGRGRGAEDFIGIPGHEGETLFFNRSLQGVNYNGDTVNSPGGGLFVTNSNGLVKVDSTIVPFNRQQWVFDALVVDDDSVVVAVGTNILFADRTTPSLSSGTIWKGSIKTKKFHQVFGGSSAEGNSYSRAWQFARDTAFFQADCTLQLTKAFSHVTYQARSKKMTTKESF